MLTLLLNCGGLIEMCSWQDKVDAVLMCYRLDKPERELKGFAKTPELAPGETCTVKVFVSKDSLASFDEKAGDWVVESGK